MTGIMIRCILGPRNVSYGPRAFIWTPRDLHISSRTHFRTFWIFEYGLVKKNASFFLTRISIFQISWDFSGSELRCLRWRCGFFVTRRTRLDMLGSTTGQYLAMWAHEMAVLGAPKRYVHLHQKTCIISAFIFQKCSKMMTMCTLRFETHQELAR